MVAACGGAPTASPGDLLFGLAPTRVSDVTNAKVLTDGVAAVEGLEWDTTLAAIFESDRAFVDFDLGREVEIHAAYLQGDNNEEYTLSLSEDGSNFVPLWSARPRSDGGLRERWSDKLSAKGRWVRVGVRGGDAGKSVTEVQLFTNPPKEMPPQIRRELAESLQAHVRTTVLYVILAFGVFLFGTSARASRWVLPAMSLVPLVALGFAREAMLVAWPLAGRQVAFLRATAAAIALLAAIRAAVGGARWPAHRAAIRSALATGAIVAFACFYNMFRPQFHSFVTNRPEFVHEYDMRVYHPFAKYFEELQYDGVYDATVLAFAEDREGGSLERLASIQVRSLRDHRTFPVSAITSEIRSTRARFTDARWNDFKQDLHYFEDVMGPEFMTTITDHGANATPVWVFFARLLFNHSTASEGLLFAAGLIDGALFILVAVALWWAYGLLPMLLAMTVFGATDVYMFGSDWAGATLRHDWLALLGFGAAALKKERWTAAGVVLGLAAMIRAFPGAALAGVAMPAAWAVAEAWRRERAMPSWKAVVKEHADAVRVLVSAGATMVGSFLLTGFLYGFRSWANWWHKVTLLNREESVNEVSLRALTIGAGDPSSALSARLAIHLAAQLGCVALIAILARRRPLHQAMLLALPLVWVFSHPSNYYSHFIFLLALFAAADDVTTHQGSTALRKIVPLNAPFVGVAFPLLAFCIVGYWVSLDPDDYRHFQDTSAILFVAVGSLFLNLFRSQHPPASVS